MKITAFLTIILFSLTACDYREYPQEEEWKEDLEKGLEEEKKESGP